MGTEEQFLKDVINHKMTVLKDDGLYRHIRLKSPDTSTCYFDLITWPGYLAIVGDMGEFVFQRLDDMFCFFRSEINTQYWTEKLVAEEKGGHSSYSVESFNEQIKDYFESYFVGSDEDKKDCWKRIESQVLGAEFERDAYSSASDFRHKDFEFTDFWEQDLKEYNFRYIWCLYAITWGIKQYDNQKTTA